MPYPGAALLRSVSSQLYLELKRMYRNGTAEIFEKPKRQKDKGILPDADITIRADISAIENYVHLNRISKFSRNLVPMTAKQQPFVSFSEGELLAILWRNETIRSIIIGWNREAKNATKPYIPSQTDMLNWLMVREPGTLVTRLLSPIGKPIEKREGRRGYKEKTIMMSLKQIRKHIKCIRGNSFNYRSHSKRGYSICGSIRTDGFRLQLLGFKLKELQSVRFRRLPPKDMPSRIMSTIGGVDYYLPEIRNIVKSEQDVRSIWKCNHEEIKILGIDLG
ncbi:hypothetical protein BGZ76_007746 [Entomortierella beljakovae]|nr:hypothetical protein BGZ76_007746 [Entomortierella beljakovae]